MAGLAVALPYISAAATGLQAYSAHEQGKQQAAQARQVAAARDAEANAAQAEAQREMLIEKRKARNLMSRARAVAAASGAGASDPTVNTLLEDIEAQGEVNALNALLSGNSLARGLRSGAGTARREARAYSRAGTMRAASTALDGATSWYAKYGT